jgi:hypothetical protein
MLPIGKRDNRVRNDRGRPPLAFARCPKVSQTALVSACPSNKDARVLIGVIFGVATPAPGRVRALSASPAAEQLSVALLGHPFCSR